MKNKTKQEVHGPYHSHKQNFQNVDKYPDYYEIFNFVFLETVFFFRQFVKEMYHMVNNKTADLYKILNSKWRQLFL